MAILPKPRLESIQSVTAFKATEPRVTRRVEPGPLSSFRRCFNSILYFNGAADNTFSGWDFAGWTKDSLGKAFVEEPTLCGRLRRLEGDEGGFEIVSNDSGARLIEAKIEIGLPEFLKSDEREDAETELVYWKDIDEQNPQFCPLLYIQVTNFHCRGYSIGISCSLLLADPPFISSFLNKWAAIHKGLFFEKDPVAKKPIFYLHSIRTIDPSLPSPISPSPCKRSMRSVVFKSVNHAMNSDKKSLSIICCEEAEKAMNAKLGMEVLLLVRDKSGEVKAETVTRDIGHVKVQLPSLKHQPSQVSWESFGAEKVEFREGSSPARVSQWIESPDGFVMVTSSGAEDDHGTSYVLVTM